MKSEAAPHSARTRPTGETVLIGSGVALALGVGIAFASEAYSSSFFAGLGLANLGMLGLVTGYIVYAISFLPGKPD